MRAFASTAANIVVLAMMCPAIILTFLKGWAQELPPSEIQLDPLSTIDLQLEVFVNGSASELIAAFRQTHDGTLMIEPNQLRNVGIVPAPEAMLDGGWIDVRRLPGVSVHYDDENQIIYFEAAEQSRAPKIIDAQPRAASGEEQLTPASDFGGLVNYTIYGSTGGTRWQDLARFQGVSGLMEGRVFGPYGVLSSSHIVSSSSSDVFGSKRLDTRWSYSDRNNIISYNAGDIITGGLTWTRSARLGGVQIRRNFAVRPDLVTMPLPQISGSAAVPSTVDVYVNNAQRLSLSTQSGPFSIVNLPVVTGNGTARMVVRDVLGRETVSETPFYASSSLLAKGLFDFSVEAGAARRNYGVECNDYDKRIVGSSTFRYGLSNYFTLEGHAEGAHQFYNIGAGGVFNIGSTGIGTIALSTSQFGKQTGHQVAAGIEADLWGLKFVARTQRTFNDYNDIASITADVARTGASAFDFSIRPPKAVDQFSVSLPQLPENINLNFSYTQIKTAESNKSRILGMTASRAIGKSGNIFLSAYKDIDNNKTFGIFAGVSWTLNENISTSGGISANGDSLTASAEIVKSEKAEVGGTGWRLRGSHGSSNIMAARGSYRGPIGRMEAGINKSNETSYANAQFDGSIVLSDGDIFFANRIDDAFGVANVGAPDVDVLLENRAVGKTNKSGKLLLTGLRSYEQNTIAIDPTNLPIDASIEATQLVVSPADRGGSVADFKVNSQNSAALITLRDAGGAFIETGSIAYLNDSTEFMVGYDGQVYLNGIETSNRIIVRSPSGNECVVMFTIPEKKRDRVTIPDAICESTP